MTKKIRSFKRHRDKVALEIGRKGRHNCQSTDAARQQLAPKISQKSSKTRTKRSSRFRNQDATSLHVKGNVNEVDGQIQDRLQRYRE